MAKAKIKKRRVKNRRNPIRRRSFEEKKQTELRRIEMGMRLRELRRHYNVEQLEISAAINISASRWFNYEHGKRPVDLDVVIELCKKYDITADWLIRGVGTLPDVLPKKITNKPK
jgi:DNA-binding transcriptional regulator YiaG